MTTYRASCGPASGHIKVTINWPFRLYDHLPIWTVPSEPSRLMVTLLGRVRTGTASGSHLPTIQVSASLHCYLEARMGDRLLPSSLRVLCNCAPGCTPPSSWRLPQLLGVPHNTLPGGLLKHGCLLHQASQHEVVCPNSVCPPTSCVLVLAQTILPKSCRGSEPRAPSPEAAMVPLSSERLRRPQHFRVSPGLGSVSTLTRRGVMEFRRSRKGDVSVSRGRHLVSLLEIPCGSLKPRFGGEAAGQLR